MRACLENIAADIIVSGRADEKRRGRGVARMGKGTEFQLNEAFKGLSPVCASEMGFARQNGAVPGM